MLKLNAGKLRIVINSEVRRALRERRELQEFDAAVQAQLDGEMSAGKLQKLLKAAERRMGSVGQP